MSPLLPAGNVLERVNNVKEAMKAEPHAAKDDKAHFRNAFSSLDNAQSVASDLVASRLDNCRSIRLPRDDEKSLLTSAYNLSMQHAVEAYQRLRTRLVRQQEKHGMRSLVVTSAGQGEGKTLTTFNLALCFARIQNWPILLVDADLRTRGISRLLGNPYSAGLGAILESGRSCEEAILRTDVTGLYVLPAGEVSTPAPELFSRPNWKELIGWSSETFRLVLVDSPPAPNLADFELIAAPCEGIVLVARTGKTSRESLVRTCAHVDSKKLLGIVLNASEDKITNGYYYRYTAQKTE